MGKERKQWRMITIPFLALDHIAPLSVNSLHNDFCRLWELNKHEYTHILCLWWITTFMYTDDCKCIISNLYFWRKNITFSLAIWRAVLYSIVEWIIIKSWSTKAYLFLMLPWTMLFLGECLTFIYIKCT